MIDQSQERNIGAFSTNSKHFKSQFIFKLISIIEDFPDLMNWSQDGQSIQILNQEGLQSQALSKYFRHSKLNSFYRQMNLYDFKLQKTKKHKLVFTHQIFKKGNELEFYSIKRNKKKKYIKQLQKKCETNINKIQKKLQPAENLSNQMKIITNQFAEYHIQIAKKQTFTRDKLSELYLELKNTRNHKIASLLKIINEEILPQIDQNQRYSTSILRNLNQFVANSNNTKKNVITIEDNIQQKSKKNQKKMFIKQSSFCIPLSYYKQSQKCLMLNWNKEKNQQKSQVMEQQQNLQRVYEFRGQNNISDQSSGQISFAN